ncbi:hypothetical protein [Vibrio scophthalmi]|uniref:Uncharacterized protein n=1 Tax=Vibrio scophthalmi LMG 19158 TaxID=870967 RepID=F9RN51_9VIBR|nr:hypothetical protein [Vibrio scophthalmi]EGU37406.1 hypothetical protein VIS19158_08825 [Vibrio scophthalmi LMG 19158]
MFNPIFEPTLNPSYQAEINVLIQCLSESITPNSIRHYAYRIGRGCFHVLKLDDQLEVTLTEGCVDIPDKENCLDYISVGHLQVSVMDSIDITYLIAAIVNHFKSLNANLAYRLEDVAMQSWLAWQNKDELIDVKQTVSRDTTDIEHLLNEEVNAIACNASHNIRLKQENEIGQLREDLNWCIAQITSHFSARPYWEEITTAYFTRGNNIDEQYWKTINNIATKQVTITHPTLLFSEAYREFNRMAFFALNVIISSLDDIDIKDKIAPDALDEILTITHQELSVRAPTSLAGHDESLEILQRCINLFCSATDTPPTDFVYYSNNMNNIRIMEANKTNDSRTGKKQ